MQKEFIPYEQALELKELGFDEPCFAFYEPNNKEVMVVGVPQRYNDPSLLRLKDFCAPLYQQAFRWFRKKGLYHDIKMFGDWDKPQYSYIALGRTMTNPAHMYYYEDKDSYEEAELACLNKLIELVKQ